MWHKHKVTVVLVSKNNSSTIRDVIESLFYTGYVDEVLVADLSSRDDTLSEVSYTKARVLSAENYHDAFIIGMDRARGELVIFGDPEGLIPATEVKNLLAYSDSYDVVFSSRISWLGFGISKQDKKYFDLNLKVANEFSKKFENVLYTDINSKFFLIRKEKIDFRSINFSESEDLFIFDLMLASLEKSWQNIQVPVQFHSELNITDSNLFGSWNSASKLISRIKRSDSMFTRKAIRSTLKNKTISHTIGKQLDSSNLDSDKMDPEEVKKRIRDLRARLSGVEKPFVPKDIRQELDNAIASISVGLKEPVKEEAKISIEEQYDRIKELDAGLAKHKKSSKKISSSKKKSKPKK